jgi:hypothetical protein
VIAAFYLRVIFLQQKKEITMYDSTLTPAPLIPDDTKKHSKIGIASFVIGIVAMLIFCIALVLTTIYAIPIASQITSPTSFQIDQSSPIIITLSILMLISPLLSLVGAVLGIVALVQKNYKKTFSIIGLVLNLLIILVFCGLFIFALAVGSGSLSL